MDGVVSDPVRPHNGISAGCGVAVDFLYAYLSRALLITGSMWMIWWPWVGWAPTFSASA